MNATVTDGPDRSAIAAAVRTNKPAPMMAPMPRATSADGPSVRLSVASPLVVASTSSLSIDLVRNREPAKVSSQSLKIRRRISTGTNGLYAGSSLSRERPRRDLRQRVDPWAAPSTGAPLESHEILARPALGVAGGQQVADH